MTTAQAKAQTARREGNFDDAELLENEAAQRQRMLDTLDQTAGRVVRLGGAEESRRKTLKEQQTILDDQLASVDRLDKALASSAASNLKALDPAELKSRLNAQLLNAQDLLREGGLELPVDYKLSDPADIARLRDQINPALANYQELRGKISEVALDVLHLGDAYETSSQRAATASAKQVEEADKDGQKLIKTRRTFITALEQEKAERDELTRAQKELSDARAAGDAASEAGQKRIKEAVEAVTKAQKELKEAEADRQKAQASAFPQETARLKEIERLLKEMIVDGTEATAAARERLVNERAGLNSQLQSNNVPVPKKSLDDLEREAEQRAADGSARDRAGLTPPPLPPDFDSTGFGGGGGGVASPAADALTNAANSTQDAADSLGKTAEQTATAAGNLGTQTGALSTAFGTLQQAQNTHHEAILSNLSAGAKNTDALIDLMRSFQVRLDTQGGAISQLQLRSDNGDDY